MLSLYTRQLQLKGIIQLVCQEIISFTPGRTTMTNLIQSMFVVNISAVIGEINQTRYKNLTSNHLLASMIVK